MGSKPMFKGFMPAWPFLSDKKTKSIVIKFTLQRVRQLPSSDSFCDISVPRQQCQQCSDMVYHTLLDADEIRRAQPNLISLCCPFTSLKRAAEYLRSSGSWVWWVILHNIYSSGEGWKHAQTSYFFLQVSIEYTNYQSVNTDNHFIYPLTTQLQ